MEHFYLLKLHRPDPLCGRGWLNTRRLERKRESRRPAGKLPSSAAAALRVPAGGDQVDGLPPDCSSSSDPLLICPPSGFNICGFLGFVEWCKIGFMHEHHSGSV